ncbi:MAG: peptide chain release factor N(5)-glutamine methyltransferase [Chloroflexota bacterium]|nr:MAG: peptide chain release factor N(5)-glutamine methyltransferase [Chloroflexota bacterium]
MNGDVADDMTVGVLLRAATAWLRGQGDDEARLDVELLLARTLEIDRAGVYAHLTDPLPKPRRTEFEALLARHANGEPIAYILGVREFYGLTFVVRPGVLIPRPETELLVEETIAFARQRGLAQPRIIEVGTGSGAVAIALAHALPAAIISAVEIDEAAVQIARENVVRHHVGDRVTIRRGDLLHGIGGDWDAVIGNLPYIPSQAVDALDRGVRDWEPRIALDGGDDGLSPHRRLLAQAPSHLAAGGMVMLEVADDRGPLAREVFRSALPGATIDLLQDVFGRDRAVRAILAA